MTVTLGRKHAALAGGAVIALMIGVTLISNLSRPAQAQPEPEAQPPAKVAELRVADAKPEPKDKPTTDVVAVPTPRLPEPSLGVATGDAGEPEFIAMPGAESIPMLSGPQLVVIPADPNKARAERVEWRYVPIFRLEEVKYDHEKKLLACRIDSCLSAQTKERVHARLRKLTGAPAQTEFSLNPVRTQSFTVELALPENKKLLLREVRAGHDITSGPVSILYRVKDDELHELLSSNLSDLALAVRSTHPYAAIRRHTATVELSMTAAREAFEKVLPKGMKLEDLERHPLIVDRDAALRLRQVLREEFRLKYEGDPARLAGLDKALEKMLTRISINDIPLHQMTSEMIDQAVIWDSKTARLDVSPSERTTMTHELEEANEKRAAYKAVWDKLSEVARDSNDAESWHNTLSTDKELDAKLNVGFGLLNADASLNLKEKYAKSDEGSKSASKKAFDRFKSGGERWEESFVKSYRKFKGEAWDKSAAGKILRLQRVTDLNALSFRRAVLEQEERLSKGMLERITLLPLVPSDTQQVDALREIDQMKTQYAVMVAKLTDLERGAKTRNRDELGTIRATFSTELPKGWAWLDGKAVFPDANWVPAHCRGKAVPDMRGQLIGGAMDLASVGHVFKKGKVTFPEFVVEGKKFEIGSGVKEHSPAKDGNAYVFGWGSGNGKGPPNISLVGDQLGSFWPIKAAYSIPEGPLKGEVKIPERVLAFDGADSNPRHVMCRFMVKLSDE